MHTVYSSLFFFFNHTATTEIYTLSLHDALPILGGDRGHDQAARQDAAPGAHRSPRRRGHAHRRHAPRHRLGHADGPVHRRRRDGIARGDPGICANRWRLAIAAYSAPRRRLAPGSDRPGAHGVHVRLVTDRRDPQLTAFRTPRHT